jgi:hypothetical protein
MSNDRGVNLHDRLQALEGRQRAKAERRASPRSSSDCRNPECQNGMTPGLIASGGGKNGLPLFGEGGVGAGKLMRWGWVPCGACNRWGGGAGYKDLHLTEDEIAQRAEKANTKASHNPLAADIVRQTLSRPGAAAAPRAPVGPDPQVGQLLEQLKQSQVQNQQLTQQVMQMTAQLTAVVTQNGEAAQALQRLNLQFTGLLEENRQLRLALEQKNAAPNTPPG